jgi:hypothetical protein
VLRSFICRGGKGDKEVSSDAADFSFHFSPVDISFTAQEACTHSDIQ